MLPPFDIFRDVNGDLIWVEPAETLDAAKGRVVLLMEMQPTTYTVFSQRTGNKLSIKPGDSDWSYNLKQGIS